MTHGPFEFDEIGVWSELKLEIVEKYGAAYTNAFKKSDRLKKYYIDGFSGPGGPSTGCGPGIAAFISKRARGPSM